MKAGLSLTPAQSNPNNEAFAKLAEQYLDAYEADDHDNPTLKAFTTKHGLQPKGSILGQLLAKVSQGYVPQAA